MLVGTLPNGAVLERVTASVLADDCGSFRLPARWLSEWAWFANDDQSATIADPTAFQSGRELSAWIGLVPRQHSSGGKQKLGRVCKQGDRYLRRPLTVGATSVMRRLPGKTDGHSAWIKAPLGRRPFRLVSLALANKMARIAWAVMTRQEDYRRPAMAAAA